MADSKLDREFLRSILTLAARPAVDHLLMVTDLPLSKDMLRGRPIKRKIIYAVGDVQLAEQLRKQGYACVTVPPYDYSRIEKVKVALVAAVTANVLRDGEDVLCLTGRIGSRVPDTVVRLQIGRGFEEKASIDTQGLGAEFSPQVVEALVSLAMAIGHEGFEGHPIGTIFVLGDSTAVIPPRTGTRGASAMSPSVTNFGPPSTRTVVPLGSVKGALRWLVIRISPWALFWPIVRSEGIGMLLDTSTCSVSRLPGRTPLDASAALTSGSMVMSTDWLTVRVWGTSVTCIWGYTTRTAPAATIRTPTKLRNDITFGSGTQSGNTTRGGR